MSHSLTDEHTGARSAIIGVHAVAVNVTNQDLALAFYRDVLGCELRFDADLGGGFRWIEVAPPTTDVVIALVAPTAERPAGSDTGIRLTTLDAPALHTALHSCGVDVDELLRWPGIPPMFSFRDPDGNTLYIMEVPDVAAP